MVKDRLLDLLSREDEEESHGEDVVSAVFNLSFVNLLYRLLCVYGVYRFSVILLTLIMHIQPCPFSTPLRKHVERAPLQI